MVNRQPNFILHQLSPFRLPISNRRIFLTAYPFFYLTFFFFSLFGGILHGSRRMALRLSPAFYTQIRTLARVLFAWRHGMRELGFIYFPSSAVSAVMTDEYVYGNLLSEHSDRYMGLFFSRVFPLFHFLFPNHSGRRW